MQYRLESHVHTFSVHVCMYHVCFKTKNQYTCTLFVTQVNKPEIKSFLQYLKTGMFYSGKKIYVLHSGRYGDEGNT